MNGIGQIGFGPQYNYIYGQQPAGGKLAGANDGAKTKMPGSIVGKDESEMSPSELRAAKRAGTVECETCASRKYQDGSDENVSFKAAAHVSPAASGAAVRAHESEHVANAYSKAKENGGKVLQASVSIRTSVCPECGKSYVAGGTTTTRIKYGNEDNPYTKARKAADAGRLSGSNINLIG